MYQKNKHDDTKDIYPNEVFKYAKRLKNVWSAISQPKWINNEMEVDDLLLEAIINQ